MSFKTELSNFLKMLQISIKHRKNAMLRNKIFYFFILIIVSISCSKSTNTPKYPIYDLNSFFTKDSIGNEFIFSTDAENKLGLKIIPFNGKSDTLYYHYDDLDSIPAISASGFASYVTADSAINRDVVSIVTVSVPKNPDGISLFLITNIDLKHKKVYHKTYWRSDGDATGFNLHSLRLWYNNSILLREGTYGELDGDPNNFMARNGYYLVCYTLDFTEQYRKLTSFGYIFYPGNKYIPINYEESIGLGEYSFSRDVMIPTSADLPFITGDYGQKWEVNLNWYKKLPDGSVTINTYDLNGVVFTVGFSYKDKDGILHNETGDWDINTGKPIL